ncbi:hypothetical protein TNCV_4061231 [Trichonephila clavipes]|nr:hypothetical protein TNCV_4061231 [Trichonephila clavipes]
MQAHVSSSKHDRGSKLQGHPRNASEKDVNKQSKLNKRNTKEDQCRHTSAIKDLLIKWADVREMVLEWHPYQADVSRFGDL